MQKRFRIARRAVSAFCLEALRVLGGPPHALTIAFVTSGRMQALNREFLGRDYPTDVLSFCYPREAVDGIPCLGDVVIAPAAAWDAGRRRRAGLDREVRKLMIHGLLHLLGYDHEADSGEMLRLQRRLLRRRGLLRGGPVADVRAEA